MIDTFTEPMQIGLAALILAGALAVGVTVSRLVARDRAPKFCGAVAALAFVGGLAYLGVPAARYVLWVVLAVAVLLGLA